LAILTFSHHASFKPGVSASHVPLIDGPIAVVIHTIRAVRANLLLECISATGIKPIIETVQVIIDAI
jgi:hypothetical protein